MIVGAGPTGVELAGTIGEINRHTLTQDFRHIDPSRTRVILIEAGPRILAAFHPDLTRKAAADLEDLGVPLDRAGRVIIEKDLSLKEHPEVFVLGDQACCLTDNGQALPGLASVAMQQGTRAANQILREIDGKPRLDFKYLDKGQMATIGRRKAIAQISNLKFSGFFAWILWLFIHVYYLIGFKNKVFVIWQWAYAYFTFKRGARLIVDKEWRSKPKPPVS